MAKIQAGKGVVVDDTILQKHLQDYAKVMGKTMGEVIQRQAALFCKDMIDYTPPLDGGNKGNGNNLQAKRKGEDAIRRSVFKLIQPIEQAKPSTIADVGRMDVFRMWLKGKSGAKANKARWEKFQTTYGRGNKVAFIEPGDLGAIGSLHTSQRTDNGHGGLKSVHFHKNAAAMAVAREKDILKYIKEKQKSVGILKSPYYHAAQKIGGKQTFPAWTMHPDGAKNAIGENSLSDSLKPSVTVGNLIGRKVLRGWIDRSVQNALSHRAYSMRVEMAAKLNKEKTPLWLATAQGKTSGTSQFFS